MRVTINGEPTPPPSHADVKMADLIAVAEKGVDANEPMVVVGVEIDGRAVGGDDLAASTEIELDGAKEIAIECRPIRAVARSVLGQGADYTGQVTAALDKVVNHYRTGRSDLAHDLLIDVTDSLAVLTGITASVANALPETAQSLAYEQGELSPWLEEMIQAQSGEDPIRLADLLEYEVRPRVESWGVTMRAGAQEDGASPGNEVSS